MIKTTTRAVPARILAFDLAAHPGAIDGATAEEIAAIDEFWGPPVDDPGGDPLRTGQDDQGTFVILAGRRVPAVVDGSLVRIGYPEHIGRCIESATRAAWRLLARADTVAGIELCFGRAFGGAAQTWLEYSDEGRERVLDLTVSAEPFDRAAYLAATHGRAQTRLPVPDVAALDAFAWAMSPQALALASRMEQPSWV